MSLNRNYCQFVYNLHDLKTDRNKTIVLNEMLKSPFSDLYSRMQIITKNQQLRVPTVCTKSITDNKSKHEVIGKKTKSVSLQVHPQYFSCTEVICIVILSQIIKDMHLQTKS